MLAQPKTRSHQAKSQVKAGFKIVPPVRLELTLDGF